MFECMISQQQHAFLDTAARLIENSSILCCGASSRRMICLELLGCGRAWQPREHAALAEARGIPECSVALGLCGGNDRLDGYKTPRKVRMSEEYVFVAPHVDLSSAAVCWPSLRSEHAISPPTLTALVLRVRCPMDCSTVRLTYRQPRCPSLRCPREVDRR